MLVLLFPGCKQAAGPAAENDQRPVKARFTLLKPAETGVAFVNELFEDSISNIFSDEYLYNGSGVAIGDVNGDSLPDIYFVSNKYANKLYINLGGMRFADVTDQAGVAAASGFKTGVTMADINGDGRLDIYVCRTSKVDNNEKSDFVFIHQGNTTEDGHQVPVYKEMGASMGLADNANTNQASFFDFDKDGDLDLFLVNHRNDFKEAATLRIMQLEDGSRVRLVSPITPYESNRLFRNDKGHFTDITKSAGVESSAFGLSASIGDFNQDGWLDVFVANDYIEPDYLYINNHDGTFTDHYYTAFRHSTHSSMGSDFADINNDGLQDLMVLDMKPEDPARYKLLQNIMTYDRYNILVLYNYGRQVARNVLQLNNGNGTYSDIGQFAGVATTDWSWSVLLADFDNDGWKDIYITNGYRKEVTNMDYINFADSLSRLNASTGQGKLKDMDRLKLLTEKKLRNYLLTNDHQYGFYNASEQSGLGQETFSNGSAYADLDLDGDLDLVVANFVDSAFIYRNDLKGQHWLQIEVRGKNNTLQPIGSYAEVFAGKLYQVESVAVNRGFLSSSSPILHFGLDSLTTVDSVILHWPDGSAEIIRNLPADRRITWAPSSHEKYPNRPSPAAPALFSGKRLLADWVQEENEYLDIKHERLLPYFLSREGPCVAVGDVNGDQLQDVFAGNGRGFSGALFVQDQKGGFTRTAQPALDNDAIFEDCGSVMTDVDGDKDLDLVVVSGGADLPANDNGYLSRLYKNDGKGNFARDNRFPVLRTNAGAVLAVDYDGDQDPDLVVTGRSTPGAFPAIPRSYLLRNDHGFFVDVTNEVFPELSGMGMVSDAVSGDLDADGNPEILFAGEWMTIRVFSIRQGKFTEITEAVGLTGLEGWWKSLTLSDYDGDGDLDLMAGNMGTNNRLRPTAQQPITLIANDFDGNGSTDPIMTFYYEGKEYPFATKDNLIGQIPILKKKYVYYSAYADQTVRDIFTAAQLKKSTYLYTKTLATMVFRNDQGHFQSIPLPVQAQWSPVFSMLVDDFNGDGRKDLLMAGNFNFAETETSEMDAGCGVLLLQNDKHEFEYVPNRLHGFWAQGEVREVRELVLAGGKTAILTANNAGPLELSVCLGKQAGAASVAR